MSDDREKQNKKTLQTSKNGLQRCFLASLGRFELPAFRLGGERSILLSYRDAYYLPYDRNALYIIASLSGIVKHFINSDS